MNITKTANTIEFVFIVPIFNNHEQEKGP